MLVSDRDGILHPGPDDLDSSKLWLGGQHQRAGPDRHAGGLCGRGGRLHRVNGPNVLEASELACMDDDAIIFAIANPDPKVDPIVATEPAAVVATGRSDYPNQINNVLAFRASFEAP